MTAGSTASSRPDRFPRRVLITTDTVGGVWCYVIELAKGLKAMGVTPIIAAFGDPPPAYRREIGGLNIYFRPCRLEWMQDPWEDVAAAGDWLQALARRLRPDLIHLNEYSHAWRDFAAPVLVVGHSCVFSWYQAVKDRLPGPRWNTYRQAVTDGLRAADGVTAPTAAMLNQLDFYYGPFRRLPVIPNARRGGDFQPAGKQPFILSAGRLWDEAKNMSALARIAGDLPWPVILAGEQRHPDGGQVTTFANVRHAGFLAQRRLAWWMAQAGIYALPAYYEPFGLTALEAALAGCALVLGDIASLRETWNGAALFVPPQRPDLLRETLRRLIEQPGLRRQYARRARQRAQGFNIERMAGGYLMLYRRLLSRSSATMDIASRAPAVTAAPGLSIDRERTWP